MNLPNKLTMLRMCLVPVIVAVLLLGEGRVWDYTAAGVFIFAALTDFFDGSIARRQHLITDFGKLMDPLADKLLVCSTMICLLSLDRIPAWPVILVIARELGVSGYRVLAMEKGVVLAASKLGKIKTTLQVLWVIACQLHFDGDAWAVTEQVLMWGAVIFTVVSFADYVFSNRDLIKER